MASVGFTVGSVGCVDSVVSGNGLAVVGAAVSGMVGPGVASVEAGA